MNHNEIKKMLQNSGKASVDQSINEEISVHINISKKENGKIKLNFSSTDKPTETMP